MRVLVLSDSDVCIRAFSKGRSSAPRILFAARRMAALLLTHDIVLDFGILSEENCLEWAFGLGRFPEESVNHEFEGN